MNFHVFLKDWRPLFASTAEHQVSQSTLLAKLPRLGRQWRVALYKTYQLDNFLIIYNFRSLGVSLVVPFLKIIDQYYNISPGLFITKNVQSSASTFWRLALNFGSPRLLQAPKLDLQCSEWIAVPTSGIMETGFHICISGTTCSGCPQQSMEKKIGQKWSRLLNLMLGVVLKSSTNWWQKSMSTMHYVSSPEASWVLGSHCFFSLMQGAGIFKNKCLF